MLDVRLRGGAVSLIQAGTVVIGIGQAQGDPSDASRRAKRLLSVCRESPIEQMCDSVSRGYSVLLPGCRTGKGALLASVTVGP